MPDPITQASAKVFVENYHDTCSEMGEVAERVIRHFDIDLSIIENILAGAAEKDIPCTGFRLYFGKHTPFNSDNNHPKFFSEEDYNLIVVGIDDNGANINSTDHIYDHLTSVAGAPSNADF